MTEDEEKATHKWLNRARWAAINKESYSNQLKEILSQYTSISINLDGMPKASGDFHKYDGYVIRTEELRKKYDHCCKIETEVSRLISKLDEPFRTALNLYYMECLTWDEVSARMCYEPDGKYIFTIRRRAMEAACKAIKQLHTEKH